MLTVALNLLHHRVVGEVHTLGSSCSLSPPYDFTMTVGWPCILLPECDLEAYSRLLHLWLP